MRPRPKAELPTLSFYLAVPQWATVQVSYEHSDEIVLQGYKIYPAQPPKPDISGYIEPPFQKNESFYQPPKKYDNLKDIFFKYQENPKVLYKNFLEYCFKNYYEFSEQDVFAIDQILGYLARLILVEDYYCLNREQGILIVDSLL